MKKKLLIFLLVVLTAAIFTGCAEKAFPSDLYIVAEDVEGAAAGEYYLPYTVNKFSDYEMKYDLSVAVNAYLMPANTPVTVNNNRSITVEKEKTYSIVVRLYGTIDGEPVSQVKSFTVVAEKADRVITFMHANGEVVERFIVPYGGSLSFDRVPELPDRYTASSEGHFTEIVSKRWVVYEADGEASELIPEYLTDVTENVPVYSEYVYTEKPIAYTISFDTDGGSEIADYNGNSDTIPPKPANPVKDGYTFVGWCTDEERTVFYNWKQNEKLKKNMVLYAKWIRNTVNPTSYAHFNFTKSEDNYGNEFYIIEAKDKDNLVGTLVLPNNYQGLPVRRMANKAFEGTSISSVTIPNCYVLDSSRGFANCQSLVSVIFEEGSVTDTIASEFFYQCTALENVSLPDGIMWIRTGAFTNCIALRTVKLPSSLCFINSRAFVGCQSLESVDLPDATVEINEEAFMDCAHLAEFNVGEDSKIQAFGKDAFTGTRITEITLPYRLSLDKDNPPLKDTDITVNYYPEKAEEEK